MAASPLGPAGAGPEREVTPVALDRRDAMMGAAGAVAALSSATAGHDDRPSVTEGPTAREIATDAQFHRGMDPLSAAIADGAGIRMPGGTAPLSQGWTYKSIPLRSGAWEDPWPSLGRAAT